MSYAMFFGLRTVLVFLPRILLGVDISIYPTLIRLSNGRQAWIKQSLGSLGFQYCLMKLYSNMMLENLGPRLKAD